MNTSKKETIVALSAIVCLLLIPITSAEILIDQPESLYNLGDDFEIKITLNPQTPVSGFLTATLVCGESITEIYRSPQSVAQNEEKEVTISARLDRFLMEGNEGECYIRADFGAEHVNSQKFEVTDEIGVTLNIEGITFNPGEEVSVYGQTDKANGKPVEGFVEVSVPKIDFSFTGPTKKGNFNITFKVPEDAPSGSYEITARAYEKDLLDQVTNQGSTTAKIRIKQVVKEIGIALSDQSTSPTEEISYSIILYDQAGEHAEGDVSVKIYKPKGSMLDQRIVRSDKSITIPLTKSSPPGYWEIQANYESLSTTKQFLVEEFRDLSFTLIENTLIVENTGNVPFTGPVEVTIGDVSDIKEIKDLQIGESLKYTLKAPDGEYTIQAGGGSEKQTVGSTFLTGRAITVQATGDGSVMTTSLWVLGSLIILLILALVAVYFYKRLMHGNKQSTPSPDPKSTVPQKKVDKVTASATAQKAKEQSQHIIDKGEKQESSIVSLHIKNLEQLEKTHEATSIIDTALWKAKEAGAKIYADGDYRIMIFSPILTKEKENEMKAIHTARAIQRVFLTHNRRSAHKVKFGLGVNTGTLIVEASQEKFRFMSLNNIIANTKRISQAADSETLIPEALRKKVVGKVKVQKLEGKNYWKIDRVVDRSAYSDHINALKSRADHRPAGPARTKS